MAILKCKMCGGDLNIIDGSNVAECEFCGTQQTIPRVDDDKKTNLFNRANHLRLANEFDRAISLYESIVNEFPDEAEAYWGLVLCKYGIEYVDDPLTGRKIPTCHRTSYESIFNDVNYTQALERADSVATEVYKREAESINNIQKGILDIVKNEKPFDVFICYKESDENGRTQDSVLAQDLYYQLQREGFKVFFARITLEDKLGTAYEPYIFAALNSAKVMVVVGTKPEYYNAVWVKNEWSRFLDMMKTDSSKTIIPAYKDMDPYDLPDALSMFQAQDMSKLGFMQDLIRGISKLIGHDEAETENVAPQVQTIVQTAATGTNLENLLKRGELALEDGDWKKADEFFEEVLNENVEEPRAYLGKLMAKLKYHNEGYFETGVEYIGNDTNYKKACRFATDELKNKLFNYNCAAVYNNAELIVKRAESKTVLDGCVDDYKQAVELFTTIPNYKDASAKKAEYEKKIADAPEETYNMASQLLKDAKGAKDCGRAKLYFDYLADYKDSKAKSDECVKTGNLYQQYDFACKAYSKADSINALKIVLNSFMCLGDLADSKKKAELCAQKIAEMENAEREKIYVSACKDAKLDGRGAWYDAVKKFEKIKGYKDADELATQCRKKMAEMDAAQKKEDDKKKKIIISIVTIVVIVVILCCCMQDIIAHCKASASIKDGNYDEAMQILSDIKDVKCVKKVQYKKGEYLLSVGDYSGAYEQFYDIEVYKDAPNRVKEIVSECDQSIQEKIKSCNIKDVVTFGRYYDKMIDWIVLTKDDEKALLISKDSVCAARYNQTSTAVTWEQCTLRNWLNDTNNSDSFIVKAFTDEGRSLIMPVSLYNQNNPTYGTSGGNNTFDNIFLLRYDEVMTYFPTEDERKIDTKRLNWFLRTPGKYSNQVASVDLNGNIYDYYDVNTTGEVRPAMYVKLTD